MEQSSEPATDPANPGNFVMTDEQWNFIYKYYPEYGSGPYDLMVWLFNEAAKSENVDSAYGKPGVIGGRGVVGDDDKEEDFESIMGGKASKNLDKVFGGKKG